MIFLTFNDLPTGVYKSQVIDVLKLLRKQRNTNVKLVAFISIKLYFSGRKKIKEWDSEALVIPSFPGMKNWKMNVITFHCIKLLLNDRIVMARGPFAAFIALKTRKKGEKVCYDGRAACEAEAVEYNVLSDEGLTKEVGFVEGFVVNESDYRLAVSEQLVKYWKSRFQYSGDAHVIIPCTLSDDFECIDLQKAEEDILKTLGWSTDDIVLIYSGSNQKWQSFELVENMLSSFIEQNENVKLLFLTQEDTLIDNFILKNSDRSKRVWTGHDKVKDYLKIASYGIMIRDQSVTNKVASPVKFAEYLSAGLKVLCSPGLGDYSDFILVHKCGEVLENEQYKTLILKKAELNEKMEIQKVGLMYFSKKSKFVTERYNQLLNFLQV